MTYAAPPAAALLWADQSASAASGRQAGGLSRLLFGKFLATPGRRAAGFPAVSGRQVGCLPRLLFGKFPATSGRQAGGVPPGKHGAPASLYHKAACDVSEVRDFDRKLDKCCAGIVHSKVKEKSL